MDRRIKILGRDVPVILLTIIAITSLASAALLSYYGEVVGTATIEQSVKIDGKIWNQTIEETITGVAGNTYATKHTITNDASQEAQISIVTVSKTGPENYDPEGAGVTVSYGSPGQDGECGDGNDGPAPTSVPAGGSVDFCIYYEFAINAYPGTYTVTTEVQPQ